MCHKLGSVEPNLAVPLAEGSTYSWVNHPSEGESSKHSKSLTVTLKNIK